MIFPKLTELPASRRVTDVFSGYNHNLRIGDGEFYDEENMCSDNYPLLSVRRQRGVYASPAAAQGLIAKDALCYVDGAEFDTNISKNGGLAWVQQQEHLGTAYEGAPSETFIAGEVESSGVPANAEDYIKKEIARGIYFVIV